MITQPNGKPVLVPNDKYLETQRFLPAPRQMTAIDGIPAFGLKRGKPIYKLVNLDDFTKKVDFLCHPKRKKYKDLLTPEATLRNAESRDKITVLDNGGSEEDGSNPQSSNGLKSDRLVSENPQLEFTRELSQWILDGLTSKDPEVYNKAFNLVQEFIRRLDKVKGIILDIGGVLLRLDSEATEVNFKNTFRQKIS
mgnify:CR=1 FL=1